MARFIANLPLPDKTTGSQILTEVALKEAFRETQPVSSAKVRARDCCWVVCDIVRGYQGRREECWYFGSTSVSKDLLLQNNTF